MLIPGQRDVASNVPGTSEAPGGVDRAVNTGQEAREQDLHGQDTTGVEEDVRRYPRRTNRTQRKVLS